MHEHVARLGNREVSLPPALDFVKLGGIADREGFASLPAAMAASCRAAHAFIIHSFHESESADLRAARASSEFFDGRDEPKQGPDTSNERRDL
jgi:hypothetical protein